MGGWKGNLSLNNMSKLNVSMLCSIERALRVISSCEEGGREVREMIDGVLLRGVENHVEYYQ